tara:strand:- start:128 stop:916 length:789 start_codon:yes stop_codon:yes gene_type:complete
MLFVIIVGCGSDDDQVEEEVAQEINCALDDGSGTISINSQDDLVEFGLKGCTKITSNLVLTNVTDLIPLINLEEITGSLTVKNTVSLKTLDGLSSLKTIRGLSIVNNQALVNIDALSSLVSLGQGKDGPTGGINISNNKVLINVNGLKNVGANIENSITALNIVKNDSLESLAGLSNITSCSKDILLDELPSLIDIGFSNMVYVGGDLKITDTGLVELNGFTGLTTVTGSVSVIYNNDLEYINGFSNLETIGALWLLLIGRV